MFTAARSRSPKFCGTFGREEHFCHKTSTTPSKIMSLCLPPGRLPLPVEKILPLTTFLLCWFLSIAQWELRASPFWWWEGGSNPQVVSTQPHPAVARISAEEAGVMSFGSGTLIASQPNYGLIITNWHVIRDARGRIEAHFPNGIRIPAVVVAADPVWDLALLMIPPVNIAPVPISPTIATPGESLIIAGYGRGNYRAASARCVQYVAPGIGYSPEMLEVSAGARQGDSGGPIFNMRGQLAGVLFGTTGARTFGSHSGRILRFLASAEPRVTAAYAELARVQGLGVSADYAATGPVGSANASSIASTVAPAAFLQPSSSSQGASPEQAASPGENYGSLSAWQTGLSSYDPLAATEHGNSSWSSERSEGFGISKNHPVDSSSAGTPWHSSEAGNPPAAQVATRPQLGSSPPPTSRQQVRGGSGLINSESAGWSGSSGGGNSFNRFGDSPSLPSGDGFSSDRTSSKSDPGLSSARSGGATGRSSTSGFGGVTAGTYPAYGSGPPHSTNSGTTSSGDTARWNRPASGSTSPTGYSSVENPSTGTSPRGSSARWNHEYEHSDSSWDYSFNDYSSEEDNPVNSGYKSQGPTSGYRSQEPSFRGYGASSPSSSWESDEFRRSGASESSFGTSSVVSDSPGRFHTSGGSTSKPTSSPRGETGQRYTSNSGSRMESRSYYSHSGDGYASPKDSPALPDASVDSESSPSSAGTFTSSGSSFSQDHDYGTEVSQIGQGQTSTLGEDGDERSSLGSLSTSSPTVSSLPTGALPSGQHQPLSQEEPLREPIDLLSGLCYEVFAILSVSGLTLILLKLFAPRHRRRYYSYRRRRYSPAYGSPYWEP